MGCKMFQDFLEEGVFRRNLIENKEEEKCLDYSVENISVVEFGDSI